MKNDSDYEIYGFGANSNFIEKPFSDVSKILFDNVEAWKVADFNYKYLNNLLTL
tara:strand:+ start:686 stop:847 length:162 start_codon:yes stop_codon:yes gene_type:complete